MDGARVRDRDVERAWIPPLVVDLDGTLLPSDLLIETGIAYLALGPKAWMTLFGALKDGRAGIKAAIAKKIAVDPTVLPYNADVLALIAAARLAGRPVYLASASNEAYIAAIAAHLELDGWFASNAHENLAGSAKTRRLVEAFGNGGFDYVGDSRVDLEVWPAARQAIAVGPSASVRQQLSASHAAVTIVPGPGGGWRAWLGMLRPHQWARNALVFVPMLIAYKLDLLTIIAATLAVVAFSVTAASVDVINDLIDIEADRRHSTKRNRPLAAGKVSVKAAALVGPALTLAGLVIAASVSWSVLGLVAGYFALAMAYSIYQKHRMPIACS